MVNKTIIPIKQLTHSENLAHDLRGRASEVLAETVEVLEIRLKINIIIIIELSKPKKSFPKRSSDVSPLHLYDSRFTVTR